MTNRTNRRRGQALLLVTFALIAMCGLLGLAVDLGWGYFVKKSAQAAGDAGAMAGAYAAYNVVGQTGQITCSTPNIQCPADPGTACSSIGTGDASKNNTIAACDYGEQNSTQTRFLGPNVKVSAGTGTPSTGQTLTPCSTSAVAGCVDYWVTVRTVQNVPQLFSAVMGKPTGISSARSTAAIVQGIINGALWTLNRSGDPNPKVNPKIPAGTDIKMNGGDVINAPGGINVSSNDPNAVDQSSGKPGSGVNGPISILSPGTVNIKTPSNPSVSPLPDGLPFFDPFAGKGQPPLYTGSLPTFGVPNGSFSNGVYALNAGSALVGNPQNLQSLPAGNYVPIFCLAGGKKVPLCTPGNQAQFASGAQLNVDTAVSFTGGGTFGNYFLYTGVNVTNSMTMGGGVFTIVGGGGVSAGPDCPAASCDLVVGTGGNFLNANTAGSAPGQVVVLTGSSSAFKSSDGGTTISGNTNGDLYPGLTAQINSNPVLVSVATTGAWAFGASGFKSGMAQSSSQISGLVSTSEADPFFPFNGVVMWQDQANSPVVYTPSGNVNVSCGDINNPCTKTLADPKSPEMNFHANAGAEFQGIVYQPRGAWVTTGGGPGTGIDGAIQLITGSVVMSGGGHINLTEPPTQGLRRIVALVE
ncbi:MAG TPA: hypothetical protein VEV17_15860 [Bryobacteraceae bacterium]|nr:hypothetical protein [Bryobacteraceae bacterium]